METIAIVTARGGSKRLPDKNMKLFCGKPLVWWTLQACRWSKCISQTWLTTDSDRIASVGYEAGINVYKREVQPDDTTAGVPISQLIEHLQRQKIKMDAVITLLPTSPCRLPNELDNAIKEYWRRKKLRDITVLSSLIPCKETSVYEKIDDETAKLVLWDKSWKYLTCSGSWGITNPDDYIKMAKANKPLDKDLDKELAEKIKKNKLPIVEYVSLPRYQQYDIDYPEDFELCEVFMNHYILKGNPNVYEDYYRSPD